MAQACAAHGPILTKVVGCLPQDNNPNNSSFEFKHAPVPNPIKLKLKYKDQRGFGVLGFWGLGFRV